MYDETPDEPAALGFVPTTGQGSLPFTLLKGEALLVVASWALESAGVELVDFNVSWSEVQSLGRPVVLHDPLCPLTPAEFIAEAVRVSASSGDGGSGGGVVVVGVRPVTDTVKTVRDGAVAHTVDRDELVAVASPVVLPPWVVAELDDWPAAHDLPALVALLGRRFEVRQLEAPPLARRVEDESSVALLEAFADTLAG